MLAIIGGTGIYKIEGLKIIKQNFVKTPFGRPSSAIFTCEYQDKKILFLARHGKKHQFLPHEINYRANIFALKKLGARQVLSLSAVGSLRDDIHPGDFALVDQYFDFVKNKRKHTFFGKGLAAHISTAKPTCSNLNNWIIKQAKKMKMTIWENKTYACVDGPRLGTKAESHFLRLINCDLVGMTNIPEVFLAREAQLCYASLGIITDYDCWMDDPDKTANVATIIARYGENLAKVQKLILALLATKLPEIDEDYRQSLASALLTPRKNIIKSKRKYLAILEQ